MSKKIVVILEKDEYTVVKDALKLYTHTYPKEWNHKDKAFKILNDISKIKK
tara:strand:+ start:3340 stop:3492 length:153 start_codon:yes stop_codon:yes gene_type:complete